MTFSLIVEDGTGRSDANAYATVAEADTYYEGHLYDGDWGAATSTVKQKSLAMATRVLDAELEWFGARVYQDQALEWPRYQVRDQDGYILDSNIVPTIVKDATAELARYLIHSDLTAGDYQGFEKIKLGSLEMVRREGSSGSPLPRIVVVMLRHVARVASDQSCVPLTRS